MEFFRRAAIESTRSDNLGEAVLSRPMSFTALTALSGVLALMIVGYIYLGSYSRRVAVSGEVASTAGMVIVRPTVNGIVARRDVEDGDPVKQGDVLYALEPSRRQTSHGDTDDMILGKIRDRRTSIASDIERLALLERSERVALESGVASLASELEALSGLIVKQRERVKTVDAAIARYETVAEQGFVSREFLQTKRDERSADGIDLAALERDQAALRRSIVEQRTKLAELPLRYRTMSAEKERQLAQTDEELVQAEAQQEQVVTAPVAGTATMVVGERGQRVQSQDALLWILPADGNLEVLLYVPTRAIAAVEPGKRVMVRYRAYPYQQYGSHTGVVSQVSKTTFLPDELARGSEISGMREPYYRVKVRLASQSLDSRRGNFPLLPGMLVDADILLEKRRLFEWIWEPVNAVARR
jgi:membrane fusion protein